jgi:hypothetical protein
MLLQSEGIRLSIHAASNRRRMEVALVPTPPPKFVDGECHVPAIVAIISFTVLLIQVDAVKWPPRILQSLFLLIIFLKNEQCTFPLNELFVFQLTAKCVKTEWEAPTGSI